MLLIHYFPRLVPFYTCVILGFFLFNFLLLNRLKNWKVARSMSVKPRSCLEVGNAIYYLFLVDVRSFLSRFNSLFF